MRLRSCERENKGQVVEEEERLVQERSLTHGEATVGLDVPVRHLEDGSSRLVLLAEHLEVHPVVPAEARYQSMRAATRSGRAWTYESPMNQTLLPRAKARSCGLTFSFSMSPNAGAARLRAASGGSNEASITVGAVRSSSEAEGG